MVMRLLYAIGVFLATWLIVWLVGAILVAIPTEPTVWLGNLLEKIAVLLAVLAGVLYFFRGENWLGR